MARKRKKSKGRKKRRKNQKAASGQTAAADTDVPADDEGPLADEPQPVDDADEVESPDDADEGATLDDAEEGDALDEAGEGDTATDAVKPDTSDDRPAAVIEVDEDLDDPDARAELIAAAAGLAEEGEEADTEEADDDEAEATVDDASEKTPDASEGETPEGAEATDEAESDEPVDEGEEAEPSAAEEEESEAGDEEAEDPEAAEGDETPLIGRDALIALGQFRDEGVATVPEELVLDLGEATSPEERDRLLAAALAHVEMQEAIYRVPTESPTGRRWKGLIAAAIFVLAVFLAALPPDLFVPAAPQALSDADRLRGIRTALLVQAEQIEAFRVREERLPASLAEVETALPGIRFVRSGNRLYQLVAYTPDGDAIVYDSAAPDPAFQEITSPLASEESS